MKINGTDVPWAIVLLCITIIAHGAITYYRVDQLETRVEKREQLRLDPRVTSLEQEIKYFDRRLRILEREEHARQN